MSGEVWAIVGVVVGAIVGGAGQVVADGVRARREVKHAEYDRLRQGYVDFMAAARHTHNAVGQAAFHARTKLNVPERYADEVNASWSPLLRCLIEVEINAPRDTFAAAERFQKELMRWADQHVDPYTGVTRALAGPVPADDIQEASDAVLVLMRRDLGQA